MKHKSINQKPEPSKHLFLNVGHSFNWSVLLSAHKNTIRRKNLESFFIDKMKPSLMNKLNRMQ